MKILAIIGSPRKCNSYAVTGEIEKCMREWGDVDFLLDKKLSGGDSKK